METSFFGRLKEFLWESDLRRVIINPTEIMNINNPSEKAQAYAVLREPELIQHLKTPCEKAQLAAISKDPGNIMLIDNPTEKVQLYAVRHNPAVIRHIQNPMERVQLEAVKRNPAAAMFNIDSPTEKVQLFAVHTDASLLSSIKSPCEKAQLSAVRNLPELIETLPNPTEKVQLAAISSDADIIKSIKNPTEKAQLVAVSKSAPSIRFIQNPAERVQLLAISDNINHAALIDNPCDRVCILFANNELGEKLIPLNTKDPALINPIREYLKEKRAFETGNAHPMASGPEEQRIIRLKESIHESLNGNGTKTEAATGGISPAVEGKEETMKRYLEELRDKGKISFANKGDETEFNGRYDFLSQREAFYDHYDKSYQNADYADNFSQRIHEKEVLDKGKEVYQKNYKLELQDTIDNNGIQKAYHGIGPDGQKCIRYTSPDGSRLEIAPIPNGGYGIRYCDNLTQGEYKPITDKEFNEIKTGCLQYKERDINTGLESKMNALKENYFNGSSNDASTQAPEQLKFSGGHKQMTITGDHAVITTNGQTLDATNIITDLKNNGVDIAKVSEKTMGNFLKGKQVNFPGTNPKSIFALAKGPVGYSLKVFNTAKQVNSMTSQEM